PGSGSPPANSFAAPLDRCESLVVSRDHFGPDVAASYDESSGSMFDADVLGRTFDVLAELAGDGAAVEFAVGTRRVGQPLAVGRSRRSGVRDRPVDSDG